MRALVTTCLLATVVASVCPTGYGICCPVTRSAVVQPAFILADINPLKSAVHATDRTRVDSEVVYASAGYAPDGKQRIPNHAAGNPEPPSHLTTTVAKGPISAYAPQVHSYVDYDQDGALDLIRQLDDGRIIIYRNLQTTDEPVYAPGEKLDDTAFLSIQADITQHRKEHIIFYRHMTALVVDFSAQLLRTPGGDIPFIVDCDCGEAAADELVQSSFNVTSWVDFSYPRFDAHVEETFYNNNQQEIVDYLDNLAERFDALEAQTGWSSERFYNEKLEVYLEPTTKCWEGWAIPAEAHIFLSDDLTNPNLCRGAQYYENGTSYYGDYGELGEHWIYISGGLHEVLHAINPLPLLQPNWLTEGFSTYYQFNILSDFGDITQTTSDSYAYRGNGYWNWEDYVANDYHDTTEWELQIQHSSGYYISAWMWSMMRDEHGLNWPGFYSILDDNMNTLDESDILGHYYTYFTDTFVIEVFGRASGLSFSAVKDIWEYDGPAGPGWGVRNWENRDWYPDLQPLLSFSNTNPMAGETIEIRANVGNIGQTNVSDVSVRFYEGVNLIDEQIIDVNKQDAVLVTANFTGQEGDYTFYIKVDEDDKIIEYDEENNEISREITFSACDCGVWGDINGDENIDPLDVQYLVNFIYKSQDARQEFSHCDYEVGDWNLDGSVNPLDVQYMVNFVYKSQGEQPQDPCNL